MKSFNVKTMPLVEIIQRLNPAKMYVSMQAYDVAPEIAKQLFKDCVSIDDFSAKTDAAFDAAQTEVAKSIIGCAYNFAAVQMHLRDGDTDSAKRIIVHLTEHDPPIAVLSDFLRYAGDDFFALCQREGKLLVPKYLDDVVFRTFAPESRDLQTTYYNFDGIGVVAPVGSNVYHYSVGSIVNRASGIKSQQGITLVGRFFVYEREFLFRGNPELGNEVIRKSLKPYGVSNIGIVQMNNSIMSAYVLFRYLVKRFGIVLNITECPDLGTRKEHTG